MYIHIVMLIFLTGISYTHSNADTPYTQDWVHPLVGGNPFLTALLYEYLAAKHMNGLSYAYQRLCN